VVLGASLGGYALAGAGEAAGRCDAGAALAGVWDPAIREEARRAVLATGASFAADAWAAAERRIDEQAQDLQGMFQRACLLRQSGTLAAEVLALHEGCLERLRGELGAVVGVLRRADLAAVRGAAQAAFGLGSPARCGDLAALRAEAEQVRPPADPAQAEAVAALRDRLAGAKAEQDAGRFTAAREAAAALVEEAERVGYAPLLAEALSRLGAAQSAGGDYEAARVSLHRGFALAEEAGHDLSAAATAVVLLHLHGVRLREPAAGRAWETVADGKLRRVGEVPALRIAWWTNAGMTRVESDRLSEGADMQRRALELARARAGEAPLDYARVLNTLSSTLSDLGQLDEAERLQREALELRVRHLGPRHPDVAVVLHNLGKTLFLRRDFEAALSQLRLALEIRERSLGPQHPGFAETLNALGVMLCEAGRTAECLGMMRRGLELSEAASGPDAPALITPLINLGNVLVGQRDFAGAAAYFERAMAIVTARGEAEGLDAGYILYNLGQMAIMRDDPAAAIEPLRKALRIRTALLGSTHVEVGYAASFLAEALQRSGQRGEAAAVAKQAREVLAAHPEAAPERARVLLVEAELLWPRDRAAARAVAQEAAAALSRDAPNHRVTLADVEAWLRAHAG
jgi:tetratricopeptide (TPR) repeat protein